MADLFSYTYNRTFPDRHVFSVSELTSLIKSLLEDNFQDVWVEGEISNLRIPSSGHIYFTLKDKDNSSQLKVVMFRSSARWLKFKLENGLHVICKGRITIYDYRGEYQLQVEDIEPMGVGALLLALEQLKKKLAAEGLFDESRKRPIPLIPRRIGIVTSPTGAAIRDILKVIERRFANVEIIISPTLVQGEKAPQNIVEALNLLNRMDGIDVIILARGGGGVEDLWAFNDEIVARAIYNSKIPVISAVGHEIDYTIADLVADLRAPTPSAAAEMVVKNKEDILSSINSLQTRLIHAGRNLVEKRREKVNFMDRRIMSPSTSINRYIQRMDELETSLMKGIKSLINERAYHVRDNIRRLQAMNPMRKIELFQNRLEMLDRNLLRSITHYLTIKKKALHHVTGQLDSLSPLSILSRGYSITRKLPSMTILTSSAEVSPGDRVDIRLYKGRIGCIVEKSLDEEDLS